MVTEAGGNIWFRGAKGEGEKINQHGD